VFNKLGNTVCPIIISTAHFVFSHMFMYYDIEEIEGLNECERFLSALYPTTFRTLSPLITRLLIFLCEVHQTGAGGIVLTLH